MRYYGKIGLLAFFIFFVLYIPHIPVGFWLNPPTSSMEPQISDCDVSVYGPGEPEENKVMMYWADSDKLVMHRIIDEKEDGYKFKGDANPVADRELVEESEIQAEVYGVIDVGLSEDTCKSIFKPFIDKYESLTGHQILVPE